MLKYILIASMLVFSANTFAAETPPSCAVGMVWNGDLGVCVKAPVVAPDNGGDMNKDVKTMDSGK
jgi:hypothetical protein